MHNDLIPRHGRRVPQGAHRPGQHQLSLHAARGRANCWITCKPRAVIYHRSLGAKFADVLPPRGAELLISVDDGSDAPELPGAIPLEDALAQGDPDREHRRRHPMT